MSRLALLLAATFGIPILAAHSEEGTYLPQVADATVRVRRLPHRVPAAAAAGTVLAEAVGADLDVALGEDASLADPARQTITSYQVDHAQAEVTQHEPLA